MKKPIYLLLVLSVNLILSQNSSTIDSLIINKKDFCNVNFSTKLSNYSISKFEKTKYKNQDLIVVPLSDLINPLRGNDEYLKFIKLGFDNNMVWFTDRGVLNHIYLSKSINKNNSTIETDKVAELISNIYGYNYFRGDNTYMWTTNYLMIGLTTKQNELSIVCRNNLSTSNKEGNIQNLLNEERQRMNELLNKGFRESKGNNNDIYRFARTENNNLTIFIEHSVNTTQESFTNYENKYIEKLCYVTADLIIGGNDLKNIIINDLKYDNVVFKVELTYNNFKTIKKTKSISNHLIRKLKNPFTQSEFYYYLN